MLALYAHFSMDTCYQTMVNHFIIRKNNVRCLKLIITAEEVAIVELFICGHTKKIIQKERSIMHGYFTNYTVSLGIPLLPLPEDGRLFKQGSDAIKHAEVLKSMMKSGYTPDKPIKSKKVK